MKLPAVPKLCDFQGVDSNNSSRLSDKRAELYREALLAWQTVCLAALGCVDEAALTPGQLTYTVTCNDEELRQQIIDDLEK